MSIIWFIRSIPSDVTLSTCVSPRSNSDDPWARGRSPTWAASGRMSFAPRPSSRTPSEITRARMTFFSSDFQAGENSLARAAKTSSPSVWARWAFASSLTADMFASRSFRSDTRAESTLSFPKDSSASQRSCW